MSRTVTCGLVVLLLLTANVVSAAPTIVVGNHPLLADTAGQSLDIFVTGGDAVQGLNLYAQVADGGPEAAADGFVPLPGTDGPAITGLDLITGTIFAANNLGQLDTGAFYPQYRDGNVVTDPAIGNTVPANGLLATLTLDTTGFTTLGGQWDLSLTNVLGGVVNTDFADPAITPSITNGTITLVESRISNANGTWDTGATWTPAGPPAPGQYSMVEVRGHEVSVDANAAAYSLQLSDAAGKLALGVGNTLTVGNDAEVAAGTLAPQITGTTAGATSVGGDLDLSSTGDVLGLDWVPGADATSTFGGDYEIAQYGSLDGTFDAINGGNINPAYVSAIDYVTDNKITVSLFDQLVGDTDLDGDVDFFDYTTTKGNFGNSGGMTWFDGDMDFDGDVDFFDYTAVKGAFGSTVSAPKGAMSEAKVVPEPGTFILLLIAAVCLFWRCRKTRNM